MEERLQKVINFLDINYGVKVIIKNSIKDGIEIAELVNKKILINKKSRGEIEILFVIAHLFGHMIQFSNYEKYKHLVEKVEESKPLVLSEDFKKEFYQYEIEAYGFGKGLLQKVLGVKEVRLLDEKYQIYLDTDFRTFWNYLITGHQISISDFNKLLLQNYVDWKGNYWKPLPIIFPPKKLSSSLVNIKVF